MTGKLSKFGKRGNCMNNTTKLSNRLSALDERNAVSIAAKKASARAIRISKALDIPVQVIIKGALIEKYADGSIKTIKKIKKSPSNIKLKKGSTLCLKPKG